MADKVSVSPDVAGLTQLASEFGAKETMDRFETRVRAKGMTVFVRIDHAAGARSAGLDLGATELLIFGNPEVGTRLMQTAQTMGIDLPLKALVWQDELNRVWLGFDQPDWLARRHGIEATTRAITQAMTNALMDASQHATKAG